MTIKKIDSNFDIALWIIFLALGVASWFLSEKLCAPEYEYVDNPIVKTYTFSTDDGDVVESEYEAVWYHENFSSPRIVLRDRHYGKTYEIKDEYLPEYQSLMPESRYKAFFYRWYWVLFPLFVILSGIIVYFVGGAIRDTILAGIIKRNPTFSGVAYFLYTDRICKRDEVKALISATIDSYLKNKVPEIAKKYSPAFTTLIIQMFTTIRYNNDTKVTYFMSFIKNAKDQRQFLKTLSTFWSSQIGKIPGAEEERDKIETLRQKKYVAIETGITEEKISQIVSRQLDKLFTELMGEEIFSFDAFNADSADRHKLEGKLFVTVSTGYTTRTISWSGDDYKDMTFPAIDIMVKIYHYVNSEKVVLWNKTLAPKCTYKSEHMNVSDLYDNIIEKTLESMTESLKK